MLKMLPSAFNASKCFDNAGLGFVFKNIKFCRNWHDNGDVTP